MDVVRVALLLRRAMGPIPSKRERQVMIEELKGIIGSYWMELVSPAKLKSLKTSELLMAQGQGLVEYLGLVEQINAAGKKIQSIPQSAASELMKVNQEFGDHIAEILGFAHSEICKEIDRRFPVVP